MHFLDRLFNWLFRWVCPTGTQIVPYAESISEFERFLYGRQRAFLQMMDAVAIMGQTMSHAADRFSGIAKFLNTASHEIGAVIEEEE